MNRGKIIKSVLAKLDQETKENFTKEKTEEIIFDEFIDRQEAVNDNYSKKIKLDDEKHDLLRKIYDKGDVKKLYTYSYQKFGFEEFGFRFDVNSGYADIKKLNN
ncbi:hypothetical protein N9948_01250 [bacterium]|nr:hypothetical protein [bacterium]